ncbi:DNA alkylation repair protein [Seonamhaeicola marinus]|uniref:DNA alkylation repair protein n=1 Tax=Seonamhaeicola marinus TaxID=1912246 RepID=A0A5D0HJQ4_9FLAO|nr:DNA alkylation repair protein [Seonamhaeicola marinus]TYA71551.1 DNA alkylation repair protein [Seonamhaeicola marinus]
MPEPLKYIYSKPLFESFTATIKTVVPEFDSEGYIKDIFYKDWENLELKERMRHSTHTLNKYFSKDYKVNVDHILKCVDLLKNKPKTSEYDTLAYMFFPDYIEQYGIDDYETSINAMETITQFASCEFAIRPFIIKYETQAIAQMLKWSKHKNLHVRRLASEGCRPRLPWAMALPSLKKDPSPILPILENLKDDTSEYVRRSVANNLNDIAKDNPNIVVSIVKQWIGKTEVTDKLVKHASRTLLKQGHQELMQLFGFGSIKNIKLKNFKILTPKVKIGEDLEFEFIVKNLSKSSSKIRLEYTIYYQKANGSLTPKVFKISEKEYAGNSSTTIHKKQSFKLITTRKFHLGLHKVAIVVNGNEFKTLDFNLIP